MLAFVFKNKGGDGSKQNIYLLGFDSESIGNL